jgi:hypothetical protein
VKSRSDGVPNKAISRTGRVHDNGYVASHNPT